MPQPPDTNHQSILIPWEKQPYYAQKFPIPKDKEKANKKAIGDQQSQKQNVFYFVQKNCVKLEKLQTNMYRNVKEDKEEIYQTIKWKVLFKKFHYVHIFLSAVFQLNYKDPAM